MRLLYLTSTGFDTPSANNHLAESFINAMLDSGLEVHLVAGRRSGENPDVPASISGRQGFTATIVDRGTVDKTKLAKRLGNEIRFVRDVRGAIREEAGNVDVALVQSSPLALLHIAILKNVLGAPVVFSAYEIIPDYAATVMKRKLGPAYYLYRSIQKRAYVMADSVIAASEDMRDTLEGKGVPRKKIGVVPNWYNDALVHEVPTEDNRFIKENDLDTSKFIVQYAGTVGYVFDVDYLLEVAKSFRGEPDVEFHVIGEGTRKRELVSRAKEAGLVNMRFFPWQPTEIMPDVYSACDISLVPLAEGTIFNAYPSKSSLLMACGTPVIYSLEKRSRFAKEVQEGGLGFVVERGSVEETVTAIRRAQNDDAVLEDMAKKEKAYAQERLRASVLAPQFVRACCKVVG